MNTRTFLFTVLAIVIGGTIANLIALKIAADQASKQLNSAAGANPLLKLFT